jgi:hypothetical protein
MSEIRGNGYGDKHDWEDKGTEQIQNMYLRSTLWQCRKCHQLFRHYYNVIPNIFSAMKERGINEECIDNGRDTQEKSTLL